LAFNPVTALPLDNAFMVRRRRLQRYWQKYKIQHKGLAGSSDTAAAIQRIGPGVAQGNAVEAAYA
jgi:hypothetical protein